MARSFWKFKYFSKSIWRKILWVGKNRILKNKKKICFERSSSIPECFKNTHIKIYKGSGIRRLLVNRYNIGFKFGEFAFTRKPFHFPLRKKKKSYIRR
jgi:ribosomal protein S19